MTPRFNTSYAVKRISMLPPWNRVGTRLILGGLGLCLGAVVLWQTAYWVRQFAIEDLRDRKAHTLNLVVENLRSELSKFQYQPSLLAKTALFRQALTAGMTGGGFDNVNLELERINYLSGALDTYLLNRDGIVTASSNWASDRSYIGMNFTTAPYFAAALQGRLGRYFAIDGSFEPYEIAYFFAYPIRRGDRIIGAIVVKLRMERLAARWLAPDHETLVVDGDGVIFMSSRASWRFHALQPLKPAVQEKLRKSKKYGEMTLATLPLSWNEARDQVTFSEAGKTASLLLQKDIEAAGWTVLILARLDDVNQRQTIALAVASFMLVSLILLGAFAHQRRLRRHERISLQAAARASLETQVEERTKELTETNVQLRNEVTERRRTEAELTKTRDELVQATKMAALGQLSAGLSHELNQPLAAIRSYSDNARAFLKRDQAESVASNLSSISELTDRMARIIRNLRIYARNDPVEIRPTSVNRALDEALVLLDERLNTGEIDWRTSLPDEDLVVNGGEVRLQQVFVNIISNAIDAMDGADEKVLRITAEERDDDVIVSIRDTGPGLPDTRADDIFDPFYSTKEVGAGMGLGLSISYGIINQFGGRIDASNHPDGGAVFSITLKRSIDKSVAAQ